MATRIVLYAPDDSTAREAARTAFGTIAALEDLLSDYRPTSELRRLGAAPAGRPVALGPDLCAVLSTALSVARNSDGAFDPTVGPLVAVWRTARRTGRAPSAQALAQARRVTGWPRIRLDAATCTATLRPGVELDLGGIAKGYILDRALAAMRSRGITRALVEAGGDIVVGDPPPGATGWRIDVPAHAGPAVRARAASLANGAISTSGGTEQFIEIDGYRYSHIIDPRTGLGSTTSGLATVIAPDAMTSDALATALVLLGPEGSSPLLRRYPAVIASVGRACAGDSGYASTASPSAGSTCAPKSSMNRR